MTTIEVGDVKIVAKVRTPGSTKGRDRESSRRVLHLLTPTFRVATVISIDH
jgi:hypothetical protein